MGTHGRSLYPTWASIDKEVINVSYSDDIHREKTTGSHWNPTFPPSKLLFQPCVFWAIFALSLHGHGRPYNPTTTFNNKCAVLGSYHNDIYKKKATPDSLQVHNPWNLMPIGGQNWSNSVFHVCALPWATPWDFNIFLAVMWWVEGSSSDFKQKVRDYFIFFHYFLTIFAYFFIFLIFCLKSLLLPSTHDIMAKKNEKVSWVGPWPCANIENTIWPILATTRH